MRVALALFALFALAYGRRAHRESSEEGAMEVVSGVKKIMRDFSDNLPLGEFQAFWNALTESLGERKGEFMELWDENKGRLDMTLEDMAVQLGEDYPRIKERYREFEEKVEKTKNQIKKITLNHIAGNAQRFVRLYTRDWDRESMRSTFDAWMALIRSYWQQYIVEEY